MDRTESLPETVFDAARLTVRLDAIRANYRECQRLGGPAAVAGVVKANGYGLGAGAVTRTLSEAGCDAFFVARIEEGIAIRPLAPEARIFGKSVSRSETGETGLLCARNAPRSPDPANPCRV